MVYRFVGFCCSVVRYCTGNGVTSRQVTLNDNGTKYWDALKNNDETKIKQDILVFIYNNWTVIGLDNNQ